MIRCGAYIEIIPSKRGPGGYPAKLICWTTGPNGERRGTVLPLTRKLRVAVKLVEEINAVHARARARAHERRMEISEPAERRVRSDFLLRTEERERERQDG